MNNQTLSQDWRDDFRKQFVRGVAPGWAGTEPTDGDEWIEADVEDLKDYIALEKEKSRQEGAEAERARLLLALKQKVYIDQRTLKGTHIDWLDVKEVFTPPEATSLQKEELHE